MRFLWKTERRSAVAQRRVSCHHFHIHHFRHFSRVARKRGIYVLTRFSVPISWNRCHAARHGNPASWHIRKLSESDAQFLSSTNEPDRTAFYRRSALPATHSLSRRPVPVRQTHDSIEDGHHDDHVRLRDRPPRGSQGLRVQGEARFQVPRDPRRSHQHRDPSRARRPRDHRPRRGFRVRQVHVHAPHDVAFRRQGVPPRRRQPR
mmetsp:Transcript_6360/g.23994  ORF Transcript_6360/g.23994 Transcript_6360/m.23994 type:complete len:205 (-) Transcript_6360:1078-1692(-)